MSLSNANLPTTLYSAAQCRELDRIAIEEYGIPGISLMKRAAQFAFESLLASWPNPGLINVFCGVGNNAGDGYIVAALAAQQNIPVRVVQVGDPSKLKGDAARAQQFAQQAQVTMSTLDQVALGTLSPDNSLGNISSGVVVDAMLGTGARGVPRADIARAIQMINASALPVLAIDLPSGLDADTGQTQGECIRAHRTITFIGLKRGLFTGRAPALVGRLGFSDLGIPAAVYSAVPSSTHRLTLGAARKCLKPRAADAHKGKFGHVLVIGGELSMGGAALMAAESAARVGAGLVSVATRGEHCASFLARRPELMVRGVESAAALKPLLAKASVVVIGPGLGQSEWSRQLFHAALDSKLPLVVDADGLNLLGADPEALGGSRQWVLTPHPGEAARMLKVSIADVQADRFAAVSTLQSQFGGVAVLKGAGSLIASAAGNSERIAVADAGNPGMASGGMGDILSGVLGGLLAQGLTLADAAEAGVLLHAHAADLAASEGGERGLLPTDLLPYLRQLVNP